MTQACQNQYIMATLRYVPALCFSSSNRSLLNLSVYWQRFQVESTAVCSCFSGAVYVRLVQRHANYRVQRMGIMMTALGSRSACIVRQGGSAQQLSRVQQTAVPPAEHCVTTVQQKSRRKTMRSTANLQPSCIYSLRNRKRELLLPSPGIQSSQFCCYLSEKGRVCIRHGCRNISPDIKK